MMSRQRKPYPALKKPNALKYLIAQRAHQRVGGNGLKAGANMYGQQNAQQPYPALKQLFAQRIEGGLPNQANNGLGTGANMYGQQPAQQPSAGQDMEYVFGGNTGLTREDLERQQTQLDAQRQAFFGRGS
ncbi:MAG: hypothetical protein HRT36_02725, partial [Alphaproteobacteria bacterium]|nr:hypothetical protein [Alphaproteobacteria bacterium]